MSKQLFNNPKGHRGAAVVTIPMHVLYDLLHARIERIPGSFDADAVCQNICVEIEKQQGTYPNLTCTDYLQRVGRGLREAPPVQRMTLEDYAAQFKPVFKRNEPEGVRLTDGNYERGDGSVALGTITDRLAPRVSAREHEKGRSFGFIKDEPNKDDDK